MCMLLVETKIQMERDVHLNLWLYLDEISIIENPMRPSLPTVTFPRQLIVVPYFGSTYRDRDFSNMRPGASHGQGYLWV